MGSVTTIPVDSWTQAPSARDQECAQDALENGRVLLFPSLPFLLSDRERRFLSPDCSDGKSKNISFDPRTGAVNGSALAGEELRQLAAMMARFSGAAHALVTTLFPHYLSGLTLARTSYRPVAIDKRPTSYRKDDRRLHADAFPSQPNHGDRILRVFTNINPEGRPRVWHIGEPFPQFAAKFLGRTRRPIPGGAWLLYRLGITRALRSEYDALMLQLHDRAKGDTEYQAHAPQEEFAFPAGASWVAFTDQVLHAATAGQYALEQTFLVNVGAMRDPARAPLRILEGLTGRSLVAR